MNEVNRTHADQEEEDRLRKFEQTDRQQAAVVMHGDALVDCASLVSADRTGSLSTSFAHLFYLNLTHTPIRRAPACNMRYNQLTSAARDCQSPERSTAAI
jgi:hypothetical protein